MSSTKPMASLANAIRTFQGGGVSHNDFFAQVDRALASDNADSTKLLAILDDENTKGHLPPDVYAELQRRVERVVEATRSLGGDSRPGGGSLRGSMPPYASGSETRYTGETGDGLERIKGVGDTLNGRFVLEECIGFGGMGTVYKALDLRKLEASDRNPYIAIKVLNVQFRGHPKSLIALQREAKKAQTLAHPNIVRVYDFDRDGPMVYLTMEFLTGGPLSRTLRAPGFGGLPFPEVLRIVSGMTSALAYAHERGLVHCDLKPANVFLTDNGEVKVIDFGIARVFHKPEEVVEATVFDPGSLGAMTPAYASPEMLEHREPDPRDDVYALACIAYELLTGRHPFDRVPATQARNSGLRPQRPQNLGQRPWKALRHALAFEREARTPSVSLFYQELKGTRSVAPYLAVGAGVFVSAMLVSLGFNYYLDRREEPAAVVTQPKEEPPPAAAPPVVEAPPPKPAPAPAPPPAAVAPPARPVPAPPPLTLDGVKQVLAGFTCSALLPGVNGSTVQVRGFAKESETGKLRDALNGMPGVNSLKLDVRPVSEAKCSVLDLLGGYWVQNQTAATSAFVRPRQGRTELVEGESVILDVTTPGYDGFVHVDYFAFDGSVLHLVPSPRARAHQAPANYSATIGSSGSWVIAPPFGTDLIVLVVTPAPLFDRMRPEMESAREYLQAMDKQLKQIAGKQGRDKIAVDFVQITTRAKK